MADKYPNPMTFRHYLTLQKKVTVSDSMGGGSTTWSKANSFWGKITPLSASQNFFAQQLRHSVTHRLVMRFHNSLNITIDNRITWQNRTFQIRSIRNIEERNRFLSLDLMEGEAS